MKATGARDPNKCPRCIMLKRLCICELMPSLDTRAKLCLIIQNREIQKPTNTGALAARCLVGSEIHVRGRQNEPIDPTSLMDAGRENIFLFPTPASVPLTREYAATLKKPVKLFVADGNWGQAIRTHRRFAKATSIPTVHLPVGAPTEYKLRLERDRPEGLATLEAIARAFGILEGRHVEDALMHIFRIRVDRLLWARGKLAADAVFGGLPASRAEL